MAREVTIIWTTAKVNRLLKEGVGHGERGEDNDTESWEGRGSVVYGQQLLKEGVGHVERVEDNTSCERYNASRMVREVKIMLAAW